MISETPASAFDTGQFCLASAASAANFSAVMSGIEARVVPHEGFELDVIRSAGLKGKSLASVARAPVKKQLASTAPKDDWEEF